MENKHNFTGIIIPVIVAVILLTVLPIINSINSECPPCEDIPTLYTPTISINDDTLTITPNSNNGAFVTGYKIYVDEVLLDTITSTTYDLSEELTEVGTYEIYVTAYATLFMDSEPSNVEEYVVEPAPTGPKVFEVGDVLPATTQLRISWTSTVFVLDNEIEIKTGLGNDTIWIIYMHYYMDEEEIEPGYYEYHYSNEFTINLLTESEYIYIGSHEGDYPSVQFNHPYTEFGGNHAYIDIDISSWSLAQRTIASVVDTVGLQWEDLNA